MAFGKRHTDMMNLEEILAYNHDKWLVFPASQLLVKLKGKFFDKHFVPLLVEKSLIELTPWVNFINIFHALFLTISFCPKNY